MGCGKGTRAHKSGGKISHQNCAETGQGRPWKRTEIHSKSDTFWTSGYQCCCQNWQAWRKTRESKNPHQERTKETENKRTEERYRIKKRTEWTRLLNLQLVCMADQDPEVIQQYLEEVEEAAEEVISDQQEVVTLDRRRNTNREALRSLRNNSSVSCQAAGGGSERTWICVGNMFMRMPKTFVVESIEKEQKQLDTEINNLRNSLRGKVNKLNDLENKEETRGSSLKPLSQEEWQAVSQVLGK